MQAAPTKLYIVKDASQYLRISAEGLRRLCRQKRIGFTYYGGRFHFTQDQLDSFIRKNIGRGRLRR